ncbi:MAG: Ig-like domain-containing protein [Burkholderiales bacterium]|nr:Ig-like domain-containing protein [Burkholderiales bacterium]
MFVAAAPVPVTNITVSGAGGAATITTNNGTLQMSAAVLPANATNPTVTWSVVNGTGSATITAGGLLRATGNGTVTVTATANDGSGVVGTFLITISGQSGYLGATAIPMLNPAMLILLALALGGMALQQRRRRK